MALMLAISSIILPARFLASVVDRAFLQLSSGIMGEHLVPGTGVAMEVVMVPTIPMKTTIVFIVNSLLGEL